MSRQPRAYPLPTHNCFPAPRGMESRSTPDCRDIIECNREKKGRKGEKFMPFQGYIRFPTIYQDSIVFVAEDNLWLVTDTGGRAERLTAGIAEVKTPCFSPDGQQLAFVGEAEGTEEVYFMPGLGEEATRLTFQSASCRIAGWSPGGDQILFASSAGHFDPRAQALYTLNPQGGLPTLLPYGQANAIAYGPQGEIVIGRNIGEPAHWKRYRGGRTGQSLLARRAHLLYLRPRGYRQHLFLYARRRRPAPAYCAPGFLCTQPEQRWKAHRLPLWWGSLPLRSCWQRGQTR